MQSCLGQGVQTQRVRWSGDLGPEEGWGRPEGEMGLA